MPFRADCEAEPVLRDATRSTSYSDWSEMQRSVIGRSHRLQYLGPDCPSWSAARAAPRTHLLLIIVPTP